jgi:mRNA interferase RelE/StbE
VKLEITEDFLKDVKNTRDAVLKSRVLKQVDKIEGAGSLQELSQVVAMKGHPGYYRIRLGDYRLGFEVRDDIIILLRCLHRREIYRYFP